MFDYGILARDMDMLVDPGDYIAIKVDDTGTIVKTPDADQLMVVRKAAVDVTH